jgi:hypothetical protein
MMRLRVFEAGRCIAVLEQDRRTPIDVRGPIKIIGCTDDMRHDLEHWIEMGLVAFIGKPGHRQSRHTSPDHPELIDRIGHRLQSCGFHTTLEPV